MAACGYIAEQADNIKNQCGVEERIFEKFYNEYIVFIKDKPDMPPLDNNNLKLNIDYIFKEIGRQINKPFTNEDIMPVVAKIIGESNEFAEVNSYERLMLKNEEFKRLFPSLYQILCKLFNFRIPSQIYLKLASSF